MQDKVILRALQAYLLKARFDAKSADCKDDKLFEQIDDIIYQIEEGTFTVKTEETPCGHPALMCVQRLKAQTPKTHLLFMSNPLHQILEECERALGAFIEGKQKRDTLEQAIFDYAHDNFDRARCEFTALKINNSLRLFAIDMAKRCELIPLINALNTLNEDNSYVIMGTRMSDDVAMALQQMIAAIKQAEQFPIKAAPTLVQLYQMIGRNVYPCKVKALLLSVMVYLPDDDYGYHRAGQAINDIMGRLTPESPRYDDVTIDPLLLKLARESYSIRNQFKQQLHQICDGNARASNNHDRVKGFELLLRYLNGEISNQPTKSLISRQDSSISSCR